MRLVATTRSPSIPLAPATPAEGVRELFYTHGDAVYRLAMLMLGSPDIAEDVVQETFLKVLRHVSAGRTLDNVRGWLFTVAAHACRDRQRAQRRWLPWLPDHDLRVAPERPDSRDGVEPLLAAFKALQQRDRALIALRAEGLTQAEIASALGIRPVSVGRLVARALERLSRRLHSGETP